MSRSESHTVKMGQHCNILALCILGSALLAHLVQADQATPAEKMKQFKERLTAVAEECNKRENSNTATTMDMFYNKREYRQGQCFILCVFEKFGLMERGRIQENKVRASSKDIPSEKTRSDIDKYMNECLKKADAKDACKKAYALAACFFEKNRQNVQ